MKCEKCGKELESNVKFCTSCGSKVQSKKTNIPIIIGVIVLVIFIIAIILLNILSKINTKEDYDNFENALEDAAANYIFKNKYELEEGTLSNVIISDLKKDNLILDDLTNKCEGYVLIEAEYDEDDDEDYDYDAYISCGKYKTKGYNKEYAKKSSISSVSNIKKENIDNESDTGIFKPTTEEEKEIVNYLNYVPKQPEYTIDEELGEYYSYNTDAYTSEKTTIKDINEELLLYMAYENTKATESDEKVKLSICGTEEYCYASEYKLLSDVQDQLKKIYNISNTNITKFGIPGGTVEKAEKYWAVGFGRGSSNIVKIGSLVDYKKTDNKITITEKAGFLYDENSGYQIDLYNSEMKNRLKIADYNEIKNYVDDWQGEGYNDLYKKYNSKFSTYKHTFLKNDNGDYYWYSTEFVK